MHQHTAACCIVDATHTPSATITCNKQVAALKQKCIMLFEMMPGHAAR
jgi:hypothetical protein